jgi:hypothetical protein
MVETDSGHIRRWLRRALIAVLGLGAAGIALILGFFVLVAFGYDPVHWGCPSTAEFNCHCSNCRATTGSAFLPWGKIEPEKLNGSLRGATTR